MLYGNALEGPNLDGVWPSINDVRKFYQLFLPLLPLKFLRSFYERPLIGECGTVRP